MLANYPIYISLFRLRLESLSLQPPGFYLWRQPSKVNTDVPFAIEESPNISDTSMWGKIFPNHVLTVILVELEEVLYEGVLPSNSRFGRRGKEVIHAMPSSRGLSQELNSWVRSIVCVNSSACRKDPTFCLMLNPRSNHFTLSFSKSPCSSFFTS